MSKHTPGPWFYTYDNDTRGGFHSWYDIESGDEKIGEIYTEVNALLIAAAPDLLEVLQELVQHPHITEISDELVDLAKQAIAKATE